MSQGGVTRLPGVAFMEKSSKAKHAEITRNRNGLTRSVKCSHFGIFSVVNRPYFVSQTIPYNVLTSPTWGPPPPCERALYVNQGKRSVTRRFLIGESTKKALPYRLFIQSSLTLVS